LNNQQTTCNHNFTHSLAELGPNKGSLSHNHISKPKSTAYQPLLLLREPSRFIISETHWDISSNNRSCIQASKTRTGTQGPIEEDKIVETTLPEIALTLQQNSSKITKIREKNLEATCSRAPHPSNQKTHPKTPSMANRTAMVEHPTQTIKLKSRNEWELKSEKSRNSITDRHLRKPPRSIRNKAPTPH
jgi:hypothetical protein